MTTGTDERAQAQAAVAAYNQIVQQINLDGRLTQSQRLDDLATAWRDVAQKIADLHAAWYTRVAGEHERLERALFQPGAGLTTPPSPDQALSLQLSFRDALDRVTVIADRDGGGHVDAVLGMLRPRGTHRRSAARPRVCDRRRWSVSGRWAPRGTRSSTRTR